VPGRPPRRAATDRESGAESESDYRDYHGHGASVRVGPGRRRTVPVPVTVTSDHHRAEFAAAHWQAASNLKPAGGPRPLAGNCHCDQRVGATTRDRRRGSGRGHEAARAGRAQ
jgi:hypothetical protein